MCEHTSSDINNKAIRRRWNLEVIFGLDKIRGTWDDSDIWTEDATKFLITRCEREVEEEKRSFGKRWLDRTWYTCGLSRTWFYIEQRRFLILLSVVVTFSLESRKKTRFLIKGLCEVNCYYINGWKTKKGEFGFGS